MSEAADILSRRVSLRQAARLARKSERFIRTKLIDGGHLRAWREGGERRPRFFVMPAEIGPAILAATEYKPPKAPRSRSPRVPLVIPRHPDVKC